MKKTILILALISVAIGTAFAQADTSAQKADKEFRTLLGSDISHGGYLGLMFNYSMIDGKDAILVGAKGAWIINHSLGIGLGGFGFANNISFYNDYNPGGYSLAGGYGGLLIEPVILAHSPVHIAVPVIIGAGGVSLIENYYYSYGDPANFYSTFSSAFFVVEPGLEIEFNLVKFMRVALGASYRFTEGLDLNGLDSKVLNGFSGGLALKFGKF